MYSVHNTTYTTFTAGTGATAPAAAARSLQDIVSVHLLVLIRSAVERFRSGPKIRMFLTAMMFVVIVVIESECLGVQWSWQHWWL